ncbi:MAG: rRNA maturation RNase YbeY [Flavobacteriales bacterium CG18_big_fil_WC_8_21_14_2_50_32_9]|nr:rRNA maturation RNase YbeY [Flavobacteriales bacterium]PIQ16738.1 MAG: rRNA maturation RNase YbeY [Flavobacteriales bacterium CG18_big_fil_WC_8_21_14_2_50_32_9]PJC62220.1 MAG: rRNA maturation RNase YbeY [Flavobacteriales bacterium CG_4_9_14_0_2_um_filter_32_27]
MSSIIFHQEDISFRLKNIKKIKSWIEKSIALERGIVGDLNYIFCSDTYLHKINLEYLKHDTLTDIITFDYSEKKQISGDIFISIDRIKENALKFNQSTDIELNRVLIHGVLHLLGYKDKTPKEKETMRAKEDFYLTLLS